MSTVPDTRTLNFGLALGGGGAKGLSHLPFLAALDELNVRPAVMAGSSIGAILAAFYAADLSASSIIALLDADGWLDNIWRSIADIPSAGMTQSFLRAGLPVTRFDELQIPTFVVAADFWSREQVVISEGDLASAIAGSAALPGLILPVAREGRTLLDGGCVNPVPFDVLKGRTKYLAAINVAGVKDATDNSQNPSRTNAFFAAFQIMQNTILQEKLKATPIDFLAQPGLRNIRVLEFNKADEIMESAAEDVARFRAWIANLIAEEDAQNL
jgi:NTE family protein